MLYWLGVYLLVAIIVAVPFLLLYLFGLVIGLTVTAIRPRMASLRNALTLGSFRAVAHARRSWFSSLTSYLWHPPRTTRPAVR
jgi:hypothetical protein